MTPTTSHSQAAGELVIDDLVIAERLRTDDDDTRNYIANDLVPSIAELGLIQPIVVKRLPDGRFELVAGWCRTQAFKILGHTTIPYCFRDDLPMDDQLAIELEENMYRLAMPWQDEVKAIAKIHKLKTAKAREANIKWGMRQTGKQLKVAASYVQESTKAAQLLELGDKEVAACESLFAVRKLLLKRKEDAGHKRLQELARGHASRIVPSPDAPVYKAHDKPNELHPPVYREPRSIGPNTPAINIDLSSMLFNMNCHDWFAQRSPESVDLVYTDIPYGINMDDLDDLADIERVVDAHDVEENLDQMPRFLAGAYKVLRDKSYLLFWYDLCHHEKLQQWCADAGFSVQPYPVVWLKTHSCKNKANHCWWTKAIETVMVCRKGTATLRSPQQLNWHAVNGAAERRIQSNPFAKPFEFSKWLLDPIFSSGMTVLDCYAGEGSLVRAVLNLGGRVLAVEKNELHYNRLVEHVRKHFVSTLGKTITFS